MRLLELLTVHLHSLCYCSLFVTGINLHEFFSEILIMVRIDLSFCTYSVAHPGVLLLNVVPNIPYALRIMTVTLKS